MRNPRKLRAKSGYCGQLFEPTRRGQRYCLPSHRQRAFEQRRLAELKEPQAKDFRLLVDALERLTRQRTRFAWSSLWSRTFARTVAQVRGSMKRLAPEIFEDSATVTLRRRAIRAVGKVTSPIVLADRRKR
jgi:hypothetical protein